MGYPLCKHEDLNLDPQLLYTKGSIHVCSSRTGKVETWIPRARSTACLAKWLNSRVSEKPCLKTRIEGIVAQS